MTDLSRALARIDELEAECPEDWGGTERFEYLRENLLLCAEEGSIDPDEVNDYVCVATHKIAKLEAENASLREVASKIMAVHDALPTWPTRYDCARAIDDVSPHIAQLSELLRGNQ
jgi:hypothetical protein